MNKERYKVLKKSVPTYSSSEYTSPLVAVGACILSHSKIVLLDNLHFMLSHLDPTLAELLYLGNLILLTKKKILNLIYLDTDSCYFAIHHKRLEDNVAIHMKASYDLLKDQHVDSSSLLGKK